eukprot:TRINITY_DN25936_c0_g1_i1.p1 TRINITY_DN25936_c0_g1~~TRINITY_DN25936_c0_g1_i1.p1  ORF type:complete len:944 (+),score=239.61 TRINITY_DN25936_c0_g1_i1:61-2892(+)
MRGGSSGQRASPRRSAAGSRRPGAQQGTALLVGQTPPRQPRSASTSRSPSPAGTGSPSSRRSPGRIATSPIAGSVRRVDSEVVSPLTSSVCRLERQPSQPLSNASPPLGSSEPGTSFGKQPPHVVPNQRQLSQNVLQAFGAAGGGGVVDDDDIRGPVSPLAARRKARTRQHSSQQTPNESLSDMPGFEGVHGPSHHGSCLSLVRSPSLSGSFGGSPTPASPFSPSRAEDQARRRLIRFLPGEQKLQSSDHASLLLPGGNGLRKVFLVLTNMKLVLSLPPSEFPRSVIEVPVGYIARTQRVSLESVNSAVDDAGEFIEVICKVPWVFVLRFNRSRAAEGAQLLGHLNALRPGRFWRKMFCFDYRESRGVFPTATDSIVLDFERLSKGDPACPYRMSCVNEDFRVCATYPESVVVPREISDDELVRCSKFRAKGRFITVSWFHPESHVSIARCAQPHLGRMGQNRSAEDERCVERLHPHYQGLDGSFRATVRVVDCRGQAAAMANIAKGGGYEREECYKVRCEFCDIENVSAVTASMEHVRRALSPKTAVDNSVDRWLSELGKTGWLTHVERILAAATRVATSVSHGTSTLVHCTNGWDRTSQVVSLAMMMVDPYYRTIEGFHTLLDKEWVAAGHKFADRCGVSGYDDGSSHDKDASPIFVLFADCVHQMMHAHPSAFEFTADFLIYVTDAVYSNRFGTFLCNSQKERKEVGVAERTVSLWEYISRNEAYTWQQEVTTRIHRGTFQNPLFIPLPGVLVPDCHPSGLRFWSEYMVRWSQWKAPGSTATQPLTTCIRKLQDQLQQLRTEVESLRERVADDEKGAVAGDAEEVVEGVLVEVLTRVWAEIEEREQGLDAGMNRTLAEQFGMPDRAAHPTTVLWIPNAMATCCRLCKVVFGLVTRRHHCRACGEVFCSTCSTSRRRLPSLGYTSRVRVCDGCDRALLEAV